MRVRGFRGDDAAASPVIGIILVVGIAIVLAVVVGNFVFGVSEDMTETAPQASFGANYDPSVSNVTIEHDGGSGIRQSNLYVRGEGFNATYSHCSGCRADQHSPGQWAGEASYEIDGDTAVVAGDELVVHVDPDYEIRIVYQSPDAEVTAELFEDEGPGA